MAGRKLIASDPSRKAGEQIKKPCSDCPWRRDALNGWLGENSKEEWIQMAHGETRVECHVFGDVQCAGIAIYRANVYKRVQDRTQLVLARDTETVFSRPAEFIVHHSKAPERPAKKHVRTTGRGTYAEDITDLLNQAESDRDLSRDEYREVLEELHSDIEGRLAGLDSDDTRKD